MFVSRAEANDTTRFLRPLRPWALRLQQEGDNLETLPEIFVPLVHTLLLIWRSSAYFNTPSRLVHMMHEICNAMIRQATTYLNGDKVFAAIDVGETKKAVDAIHVILRVFGRFKTVYFEFKVRRR